MVSITRLRERRWLSCGSLRDWHWWKTKTLTTMVIVLIPMRIKMNILRRWHGISISHKIRGVKVRPLSKLFWIVVQSVVLWNQLACLGLTPLSETGAFPSLNASSSRICSERHRILARHIRKSARQKLLGWITCLPSKYYYSKRLQVRWYMLRRLCFHLSTSLKQRAGKFVNLSKSMISIVLSREKQMGLTAIRSTWLKGLLKRYVTY